MKLISHKEIQQYEAKLRVLSRRIAMNSSSFGRQLSTTQPVPRHSRTNSLPLQNHSHSTVRRQSHNKTTAGNRRLNAVELYMNVHSDVKNLLYLDESSLPSGTGRKFRVTTNIREVYDVEKVANYFRHKSDISVKYIYLHRNFYKSVRSHLNLDGGFHKHALMLEKYAQFIRSEYARTELYMPSIWTAVRYEWLHVLTMKEFETLIYKIIEFLDWKDCSNVNISRLHRTIKSPQNSPVNVKDFEFAGSLDTDINIPFLMDLPNGDDDVISRLKTKMRQPNLSLELQSVNSTTKQEFIRSSEENNWSEDNDSFVNGRNGIKELIAICVFVFVVFQLFG